MKRGQNEGTIRQRPDGRWEARVTVGRNPNGSQKQRSFYGRTRKEVHEAAIAAQNDLNNGVYTSPSKMTVGEWLDVWFREYVLPLKRPSTARGYDDIITLHLKPELGTTPLRELRPEHLQALYNQKIRGGLSPRTVQHINAMLNAALGQALKNGLLTQNICRLVALPKVEPKKISFFTREEQRLFLEAAADHPLGLAFEMCLATGLRQSELLGLRWSDLQTDGQTDGKILRVNNTIMRQRTFRSDGKRGRTAIVEGRPKTTAGVREIPLSPLVCAKLEAHRRRRLEYRLSIGELWNETGFIFTSEVGTPIEPRRLLKMFHAVLMKAGLKKAGLHTLRHTFATRAVEAGMNIKILSTVLGHKDIATTLNLYVHASDQEKQSEMKKLDFLFF
ncbi:MAG: site-specific integrase [Clostridiales bacterium]|jgi:integrase|nr:site-specific integrase [Clostridiales bacterium]